MNPIHTALIYAILCAVGHGMVLTDKGWPSTRNGLITGSLFLATGLISILTNCFWSITFQQHTGLTASFLTALYMVLSVILLTSTVMVTASRRTMDAAFSLLTFLISMSLLLLFSMTAWVVGVWLLIALVVFILLIVTNAGYVGVSAENPPRRWSHPFTLSSSLIGLFMIVGWVLPAAPPVKDYYTSLSLDNKILGVLVTMLGLAGVFVHRHAALSLYSLGITWCGVMLVADGVTMFWKPEHRILTLSFMTLAAILQIYLDGVSVKEGLEKDHSITWRIIPRHLLGQRRVNQDQEIY